MTGSAALNLAFIAGGHCDIYCHAGIHCWDMAAGALLVQEAGGRVLDPSGRNDIYLILKVLLSGAPSACSSGAHYTKLPHFDSYFLKPANFGIFRHYETRLKVNSVQDRKLQI